MTEEAFTIRPLQREDREWVAHFLDEHWGSTQMVTRGRILYGHLLPGFVAERSKPPEDGEIIEELDDDATEENPIVTMEKVGLLTYNVEDKDCEIVSLNSTVEGIGIGTALVRELIDAAKDAKIHRIWLITTNDNLPALKFFQKRKFEIAAVHRDSIQQARRLKPQIPITGVEGIPIRDEIELELPLK
ncbi:MAG: GNAT family N-acetyltransferase [Phototrophicaceae bacterium]